MFNNNDQQITVVIFRLLNDGTTIRSVNNFTYQAFDQVYSVIPNPQPQQIIYEGKILTQKKLNAQFFQLGYGTNLNIFTFFTLDRELQDMDILVTVKEIQNNKTDINNINDQKYPLIEHYIANSIDKSERNILESLKTIMGNNNSFNNYDFFIYGKSIQRDDIYKNLCTNKHCIITAQKKTIENNNQNTQMINNNNIKKILLQNAKGINPIEVKENESLVQQIKDYEDYIFLINGSNIIDDKFKIQQLNDLQKDINVRMIPKKTYFEIYLSILQELFIKKEIIEQEQLKQKGNPILQPQQNQNQNCNDLPLIHYLIQQEFKAIVDKQLQNQIKTNDQLEIKHLCESVILCNSVMPQEYGIKKDKEKESEELLKYIVGYNKIKMFDQES